MTPHACLLAAALVAATATAAAPPAGLATVRVAPEGRPAATYATRWRHTPGERRLAAEVRLRFRSLRFSPCLARAARAYAAALPADGSRELPLAAIEFLVHWAGCPDATAAATVLYTTEDGADEALDALGRLLARRSFAATTHVGLARVPAASPPYRWRWGILLARRRFELDPVPTSAAAGAHIPLVARLDPGLAHPRLLLLAPGGEIEEVPTGASGRTVTAAVPLPEQPGTAWVELVADGDTGPEVVALFPVAVGRPPPAVWEGQAPPPEPPDLSPDRAERLAFELLNRDRVRHGLRPLAWDERLAAVARAHSRDMAEQGYFGHVSPSGGGHRARLAAAGYRALVSAENISHAQSVAEAEQALMRSPGHRANILDPRVTRVGIGLARDPRGELRWLVTQLFALPAPELDAAGWERAVRRRLESLAGRSLAPDPALDALARRLARLLLERGLTASELAPRAVEALRAEGRAGVRVEVRAARAWTPERVGLAPPDPDASVGVGAALAGAASPAAVVVVLVAPAG